MFELNRKMKVFSKLYVGVKKQGRGEELLGFATPYEDNAQGRQRQETVDRWCRGYDRSKPETKIVDNVPRTGFKITDDVKRVYWGGGNVVFRVWDPYGYELEIQSQNLMALLLSCGINAGGEIPGSCVWGRDGSTNVLLHESSEEYKNAIQAAETLKKPKMGKGEIGKEYLLLDGTSAFYLGKRWVVADNYDNAEERPVVSVGGTLVDGEASARRILEPEIFDAVYCAETKTATFYKKAPLISPTGKSITSRQAEAAFNGDLRYASSSKSGQIRLVTEEEPKNMRYALRALTDAEFEKQLKDVERMASHFRSEVSKSAGQMHFFNSWPDYIVYTSGGKLFAQHFDNHTRVSSNESITRSYLGSLVLGTDRFCIYSGRNSWFASDRARYGSVARAEALELPQFRTVDEVLAWCNLSRSLGTLMKVTITCD